MCRGTESQQDADTLVTTQSIKYKYHNKQFKIAQTGNKVLKTLHWQHLVGIIRGKGGDLRTVPDCLAKHSWGKSCAE